MPHADGRLRYSTLLAAFVLLAAVSMALAEEDLGWPRQIDVEGAKILLYQPQLDSFEGDRLAWRAAVSVTPTGEEPRFGAVWVASRIETDRETRMVSFEEITVERVRFPEADEEHQQRLAAILEREVPKWELTIALDRLTASMDALDSGPVGATDLETKPPKILFVDEPAVLVTLDGKPQLREAEGTEYMLVVNTPFLIAFQSASKTYYLDGGEIWYIADDVMGPWKPIESPPADVVALRPPPPDDADLPEGTEEEGEEGEEGEIDERIPKVIVATEPTELIVADGEPAWTPLENSDLLFMSNSESFVLLEVDTQRYFIVLSGRWYASKSLDGPWSFVASDELPEAFAEISAESEMAGVRPYVSGTDEARDAVLDNMIPQTAEVVRKDAKLEVTYDGDAQFEPIEETELKYAVNTQTPVILADGKYYACDSAVWFVGTSPAGPWKVADTIPASIYGIPPSSPVYNVIYVHVYDSTPDVVYVGYTPGYTGSYVYYTTIVYGTGYYYPGWYGRYYWARPATWGFHVRWNPWYGWSFGLSYSTGRFTISIGRGGFYGWWGPRGWRGYRHGYHRGYRHGYRHGYQAGARAGYRAGQHQARNNNLYRNQANQNRVSHTSGGGNRAAPATAQNRANNVYTDKNGDIYRRNEGGWEKRDNNSWSNADLPTDHGGDRERPSTGGAAQQPARPESGSRPSTAEAPSSRPSGSADRSQKSSSHASSSSNLNRDYNARSSGAQRTNNYRSSGASRGGSRGGGGRRR